MKLEFLYIDESYKSILEEKGPTCYSEIKKDGLFIISYEETGYNDKAAKILSGTYQQFQKNLDPKKFFTINNEAGEYFNQNLYPLCNKFERLLRQVLCIASVNSNNSKSLKSCKKLEKLNLIDIYNTFFTDPQFSESIKSLVQNRNVTHKDLIGKLFEQENTLWKQLFDNSYAEVADSFIEIKEIRNNVMHANNMDYYSYTKSKELLTKINQQLENIINELLKGSLIIPDSSSTKLTELIESVEENSALSEKEKVDLIMEGIHKIFKINQ